MNNLYDMMLEREEIISPEEYLRRRENGQIDPAKVRFLPPIPGERHFGKFAVKLDQPRYRMTLPSARRINYDI